MQVVRAAAIFQAQLNCRLSVWLQQSQPSAHLRTELHTFSPAATFQLCLEIYRPAACRQLTCNLVCSLVFCHTVFLSSFFLFVQPVWEAALLGPVPSAVMLLL